MGDDGGESRGLSTPTSTYTHRIRNSLVDGGRSKSIPEPAVAATAWKLKHPRALPGFGQVEREEMVQEGHRTSNAHHGLADKGKDGEESDRLGI